MEEIDFKWDLKFLYACGVTDKNDCGSMVELVYPIRCLYDKFLIIGTILERGQALTLADLSAFDFALKHNHLVKIKKERPIYEAVFAIMVNDLKGFKRILKKHGIDVNHRVFRTVVFYDMIRLKHIAEFTFLTIAAMLGRLDFVKYLIDKGADVAWRVIMCSVKPYLIPLNVTECMLLNAAFQWYQSGMKVHIDNDRLSDLVDLLILAGSKAPEIVNNEAIHPDEVGVRITWYWEILAKIAGSTDFIQKLMPLNPNAIKALYGLS